MTARSPRTLRGVGAATLLAVGAVAMCSPTPTKAEASPAGREAPEPPASPRLDWPLPAPHTILRPYEAPATRYMAGHRGVDLPASPGAVVTAPADGAISFAGTVVDRPVVTVDVGGGLLVSMEPVAASLTAHSIIRAQEQLGTVANGGHCGGVCLHLGVRVNGEYVSPLPFLGGVPRAILLPLAESGQP